MAIRFQLLVDIAMNIAWATFRSPAILTALSNISSETPRREICVASSVSLREGLTMGNGTLYNTAGREYNATRMGFASLTLEEQDRAIDIVKRCL